jgi:hypothetical protein
MRRNSIIMMREKVEALRKMEPEKMLSLNEIKLGRHIPWAFHSQTIMGVIKADLGTENILQVEKSGARNGTRYSVKVKNLINYLERYWPVMISFVQSPKKNGNKNHKQKNKRIK